MTGEYQPFERLSPRYEVSFACSLTEMAGRPHSTTKRSPKHYLGVIDELSINGGQLELSSRVEWDPEITRFELEVEGVPSLIRVLGHRVDRGRRVVGFDFLELSPGFQRLLHDSIAEAKGMQST
ncbi:MAG: hypothetical protein GY713_08190 [Actinomycetia bacterium]|nr:hypothetical protein [Actinomycetes bacterium]MCP3910915.1 hypothetical protein [Actinomycetes bacterium]